MDGSAYQIEGAFTVEGLIALGTLTAMETVLGIDNVVFLAILAGKLPEAERNRARVIGLLLAIIARLALLFSITWIIGLTKPVFTAMGREITGRDLVLMAGGLFLIWKATTELHTKVEGQGHHGAAGPKKVSFRAVLAQIVVMDVVFSLDSVITAVGMAKNIWVMAAAVVISIGVMLAFSRAIVAFIDKHPTIKVLALSFLLLIGVMLVADGLGQHIPKGYIYFAMAFSLGVEMLNLRLRSKAARPRAEAH